MSDFDPGSAAEFELTIQGGLGPVMCWALRPSRVVDSATCTTIRTVSDNGVAELVALLDSHGLRIESVLVAPRGSGPPWRGHPDTPRAR